MPDGGTRVRRHWLRVYSSHLPVRIGLDRARHGVQSALGGPQRWRAVLLLACVMALDSADAGVIGAIANDLRHALHISNTQIGLLTSIPSIIGALATIPVGQVVDRFPRVPLLVASVALWSLATAAGGLAQSYLWLLLSRVALGAVTATAGPMVASLTGDLFPAADRGGVYGRILSGELLGAGLGLVAGSDIAAISWRAAFWLLALLGVALAFALWKQLPEPRRTQTDEERDRGQRVSASSSGSARQDGRAATGAEPCEQASSDEAAVRAAESEAGARVVPELVVREDPAQWSLWRATKYVLSIRTNVLLIIASAIGYFFFAGLHTFAFELVRDRYGVGRGELSALVLVIGAAALAGVNVGGRLADRLDRSGYNTARVIVPGAAYALSALLFVPGLLTRNVWFALIMFSGAAGALAAANPPLDAARLDIVHPRLWGRAESVRTVLRMGAQAMAPVVFGWLSDTLGTGPSGPQRTQSGVDRAFLIGLGPLMINGLLLLRARRSYPADVATAKAGAALSARRMSGAAQRRGEEARTPDG